ncbi:MAG TPA: PqqD family peptide modification chaperone [Allosphingosinicella sp.]|nr:PqqD family peptide modification chaperone [Allosphingosinicella sp.]
MNVKALLDGGSVVARSEALLTAEVDGELIAMSVDQGACYGMNPVGTRIWALLAEPRTIDSLCDQLAEDYDVDPATCRRDVLDLLDTLAAEKLVTVKAA